MDRLQFEYKGNIGVTIDCIRERDQWVEFPCPIPTVRLMCFWGEDSQDSWDALLGVMSMPHDQLVRGELLDAEVLAERMRLAPDISTSCGILISLTTLNFAEEVLTPLLVRRYEAHPFLVISHGTRGVVIYSNSERLIVGSEVALNPHVEPPSLR